MQMRRGVEFAQKRQSRRQRFGPRRLVRRGRADRSAEGFYASVGVAQKTFLHRPQGGGIDTAAPGIIEAEARKGIDRHHAGPVRASHSAPTKGRRNGRQGCRRAKNRAGEGFRKIPDRCELARTHREMGRAGPSFPVPSAQPCTKTSLTPPSLRKIAAHNRPRICPARRSMHQCPSSRARR